MGMHQVKWSCAKKNDVEFRSLSCFSCQNECTHNHAVTVNYDDNEVSLPASRKPSSSAQKESDPQNFPKKRKKTKPQRDENQNSVKSCNELVKKLDISVLREGDYVCVEFNMEQTAGVRRWLGEILRVNENDTFLIRFL